MEKEDMIATVRRITVDERLSEELIRLEMLNSVDSSAKPIIDAKNRIQNFIKAIKSNDSETINELLAI